MKLESNAQKTPIYQTKKSRKPSSRCKTGQHKAEMKFWIALSETRQPYQQAEKDGLVPSYEEAYEANEQNYQLAKTYAEDSNYANEDTILAYEILKAYMKAKHWNEKEYLEQTAYEYQINMAVGNLYNKFKESYADEADENKIRAAYEDYLDTLVEEADIQYFDME